MKFKREKSNKEDLYDFGIVLNYAKDYMLLNKFANPIHAEGILTRKFPHISQKVIDKVIVELFERYDNYDYDE